MNEPYLPLPNYPTKEIYMSEQTEDQDDLVKSLRFANEFLKVTRGFKVESQRPDGLPQELREHLANEHLNSLIEEHELEPEMLIWGLLHMLEVVLKYSGLSPEELSEVMEQFIHAVEHTPELFEGDDDDH
jgi:hypothetical protein